MKSIIRSIKHILLNIYDSIFARKKFQNNSLDNAVLVMLAADYNNLGDVAITYAQKNFLQNVFKDKNIIENEFYLYIWEEDSDNVKEKILKRANNWKKRFKDCGFETEILEKTQIILLAKSFTIPEFARKESVDYDDSIVRIRRRSARNKQNI